MNQSAEPFCRNDRQDLFFKNEEVPGSIFNMIMFRDPFLNTVMNRCRASFLKNEQVPWPVFSGLNIEQWQQVLLCKNEIDRCQVTPDQN